MAIGFSRGMARPVRAASRRAAQSCRPSPGAIAVALGLLGASWGCSRGASEAETALKTRVQELEAENQDLARRLADAESTSAVAASSTPTRCGSDEASSPEEAPAEGRPPLTVVKLVPGGAPKVEEGASEVGEGEEEGPDVAASPEGFRPLLRLHGNEEPKIRQVPIGKDEPQALEQLRRPGAPRLVPAADGRHRGATSV